MNDDKTNKAIVKSLRLYLSMVPGNEKTRHIRNIEDISYARDGGTKAFVALEELDE